MSSKRFILSSGLGLFLIFNMAQASDLVIPADAKNKIIGVRLNDLAASFPSLIPGLANLAANLIKSPEAFFNQNQVEVLHDVFLNRLPDISGNRVKLNLVGFVKYKDQNYYFEKFSVSYDVGATKLVDLSILKEEIMPLKEMMFQVKVGLVDRKVIIEDLMKDVKIIFPIGVGAFDEGVMNEGSISLVTPRFQNGFIDQRAVITKREKPRYFAGKPFIRILKGSDLTTDSTAIGFHIEINDSFVRGFDSHGCMRLREGDLMAFHDLIMNGSALQTPVSVRYRTEDPADHPTTKRNKIFKSILNSGSLTSPFFIYDRDNLVQMVYKENLEAPTELLVDQKDDDYYQVFNYETGDQMKEQNIRRKNECDAKVMNGSLSSDKKKYQECLDAGKRKDSLKDRIYRKFMGIDEASSGQID